MNIDIFQEVRRAGKDAVPLLAELADINETNEGGENLLHAAVSYHNHEVAVELIRRGVNVNAQDAKGQTPLHFAATLQDVGIAEAILASGGDFAALDEHCNTPLWNAVFHARGQYALVELLVRFGALKVANCKNKHGRSPVDFANQIGDEELLKRLTD
jgi:uncharacterized protein